jgi:hypothetical protein
MPGEHFKRDAETRQPMVPSEGHSFLNRTVLPVMKSYLCISA